VAGILTLTDGFINQTTIPAGGSISAQGDVTINAGADGGTAAFTFSGGNAQTYTDNGGVKTSGTVTVNKDVGSVLTLATSMSYNTAGQDLAITQGTLDLAGFALTVNDQFAIGASGTLKLQSGEAINKAPTSNSGTVLYCGTSSGAGAPFTLKNWTYQNLTINSAHTSADIFQLGAPLVVNGAFTITKGTFNQTAGNYNVTISNGGSVAVGAAGVWKNLGSGDLSLGGDVANSGIIWFDAGGGFGGGADDIAITKTSVAKPAWSGTGLFLMYDVAPSNQGGTATITCYSSTNDASNDPNWVFPGTSIAQRIWGGGSNIPADGAWTVAANWGGDAVPSGTDVAVFSSFDTTGCAIAAATNPSLGGIDIRAGYTGTLTQGANNLTIGASNFTQAGGTFSGYTTDNSKPITINSAFVLSGGVFNSTQGTLTIASSSGASVTVFSQSGGTFTHNSGTVAFANNSNSSPVLTIDVNNSITFNHVSFLYSGFGGVQPRFTVASADTLIVAGDYTQKRLNGGGGIAVDGGTIEARGGIIQDIGAGGGTAILKLNGSGAQTYQSTSGSAHFPVLTIDKSTGTVSAAVGTTQLGCDIFNLIQGSFTAPSGTFDVGLTAVGSHTLFAVAAGTTFTHNSGKILFHESVNSFVTFTIDVPASLTVFDLDLDVGSVGGVGHNYTTAAGDTLIVAGTFRCLTDKDYINGSWEFQGDVVINGMRAGGTAVTKFTGGNSQIFTLNTGTYPSGTVTIDKTANAVTLASALSANTAGQDLTIMQGTLDIAGFALTVNDVLTVGASGTLQLQGGETVTRGALALNAGSTVRYNGTGTYTGFPAGVGNSYSKLAFDGVGGVWQATGAVTAASALTIANGTFDLNGRNLNMTGATFSNDGTLRLQGIETLTAFTNDTNSGTVVYNGTAAYGALAAGNSYFGVTFSGAGGNWTHTGPLSVNGNLSIAAGTLTSAGQDITLAGNWSNGGAYVSGANTVTLSGAAQSISGTTAFNHLTAVTPSQALTFQAGATQTISGALTLNGQAAGTRITLRSSTPAMQWRIDPQGARAVSFVDVRDSNNLTLPYILPANSFNAGNNTHWFNTATTANDDAYSVNEDGALNVPALTGVLANDSDPEGDPLTAILVANAANGALTLNADGSFTYTPALNFNGADTFTYKANDGTVDSNVATVTIAVNAVNDVPSFIKGANQSVLEDSPAQTVAGWATALSAGPADEAGQALDFIVSNDNNALFSAQPAIAANGDLTYTPAANANGLAAVTVQIHDNGGTANGGVDTSAAQTFTITVTAVNDAPVAAANAYSTSEDTVLSIAAPGVLNNDTDGDGDALSAVLVAGPAGGALTLNANGSFVYTPNLNFNGADSFSYKASDGTADSNTVTVTIAVTPVNDAPVAVDDAYSVNQSAVLAVPAGGVLSNDSDVDGDALTAVLVSGTSNGILALNADGSFTYTPNASFSGTDTFFYQASDGTLLSNIAAVTLTVAPLPGGPSGPGGPGGPADDPDGDGFTNGEEDAGGTNAHDPASHPTRMGVAMMRGLARFNTTGHDAWLLQARLPGLPENYNPAGVQVTVDCAGAKTTLTFDAKGKARAQGVRATLLLKKRTAEGTLIQIRATRGSWAQNWTDEGVDPEASMQAVAMSFVLGVRFPDRAYVATAKTLYTSIAHRGGKFTGK